VIGGDRPDCERTDLVIEAGEGEIDLAVPNGGQRLWLSGGCDTPRRLAARPK
jgi:hypothetical protein